MAYVQGLFRASAENVYPKMEHTDKFLVTIGSGSGSGSGSWSKLGLCPKTHAQLNEVSAFGSRSMNDLVIIVSE